MSTNREFNARPSTVISLNNPERKTHRAKQRRSAALDAFKGPLTPIPFFGVERSPRFEK
jgi:hypothetical protein